MLFSFPFPFIASLVFYLIFLNFFSYDVSTKSGRTQLALDKTALMYVVRDTYERAYLVVSLGEPNLLPGQLEATTIMQFRLVNVTGNPSPIVKDDATGDSYNWNNNRGRFNWRWKKSETDGKFLFCLSILLLMIIF